MPAGHYDRTKIPRKGRPGFLRGIFGSIDREWMHQALCAQVPVEQIDDMFFPVHGRSNNAKRRYQLKVQRAKQLCEQCPVRQACEDYRHALGDENGVWGGRDELDRDPTRSRQPAGRPRLHSIQEGSTHT